MARSMKIGREHLVKLAVELGLDVPARQTTAEIYTRCLERASHARQEFINQEASDPDREDWPWTGD